MRAMQPLTEEERRFATENHNLVFKYLKLRKLPPDEYYDVVIFRYLRSVKRWFSEANLRQYNFEIIAFYAMRSAIGHYQDSKRRRERYESVFSFQSLVPNTENLTFADVIPDPQDLYSQVNELMSIRGGGA